MNWPNALTILRLILVPVFACLYAGTRYIGAFAVYILAALTDMLDGYLARRLHQITDFGKVCDPLADKLMQITMLACLTVSRVVPNYVVIVLAVKELCLIVGAGYLLRHNIVVASNIVGKAATFLFIVAIAMVYPWHDWAWMHQTGQVLLPVALGLSVLSMIVYGVNAWKRLKTGEA